MPVVVAITVVLLGITYFKTGIANFLKEGLLIEDMLVFNMYFNGFFAFPITSPMQMSITNYTMDIGLTYLIIPTVTVGNGLHTHEILDKYMIF